MDIQIRTASDPADLEAVARLRYQVFVREMDRRPEGTDDENERIPDPSDALSTLLGAYDGAELVACLRLTPVARLPADSPWREVFRFGQFPEPESRAMVFSHLIVRSDRRDSDIAERLVGRGYDAIRDAGADLVFLLASPNMVPLYEVLGCRRYTDDGIDLEGLRLPMVMIAGDLTHFESVKSPLLDNLRRYPLDVSLGDWFDRQFPQFSRPASQRAVPVEQFMRQFSLRLNDAHIPLLDDLDSSETTRLLASATQVQVAPGEAVLRQGDAGTNLFLILEGAVEVSLAAHGRRRVLTTLGAGQIFGEAAFLLGTARSADVTALAASHLLSISTDDFDTLSNFEPGVAVKLLRNLSRMLCGRLYAGSTA